MIVLLLIPFTMALAVVFTVFQQDEKPQHTLIETVEYPQKGVTCYLYKHTYFSCVKTEAPK